MSERRPASRVLVVDDDDLARYVARESLAGRGYEVLEASRGEEALACFEAQRPHIVLLDVEMPGPDGYEVCRQIRQSSYGADLPVVMMTAHDDEESIDRAYEVGATDFAVKPVQWVILGHRIEYLLRASRAYTELRASRERLSEAQKLARLGSWEWYPATGRVVFSHATRGFLGLGENIQPVSEVLERVHPEDQERFRHFMRDLLSDPRSNKNQIEYRILTLGGEVHSVRQVAAVFDDSPPRVVGTVQDITDQRKAQERIRYLAEFDSVTGLPNRRSLVQELESALACLGQLGHQVGVFHLDLDRFNRVNETLGHTSGDEILKAVGRTLERVVPKLSKGLEGGQSFHLSHVGSDEFVLLAPGIEGRAGARVITDEIANCFERPFAVGDRDVLLTASQGYAIFPRDGMDADTLLEHASSAKNYAKTLGGGAVETHRAAWSSGRRDALELETELHQAIELSQLSLRYQPLYDRRGRIAAAEALARWDHPDLGSISPGTFIPLAEETGLIVPLGEWVLHTAAKQLVEWTASGFSDLRVAVNVSGRQFAGGRFAERLDSILAEHGLSPERLELEVTERVLLKDVGEAIQTFESLKRLGVQLSIDDFGTGFSSLNYLRRFSPHALKIDRSFLEGVPNDREHKSLVRAILAMAKSFDLRVVAEGVETHEQKVFLLDEGCDELQGFLLGRPMSAASLALLLGNVEDEPPEAATTKRKTAS